MVTQEDAVVAETKGVGKGGPVPAVLCLRCIRCTKNLGVRNRTKLWWRAQCSTINHVTWENAFLGSFEVFPSVYGSVCSEMYLLLRKLLLPSAEAWIVSQTLLSLLSAKSQTRVPHYINELICIANSFRSSSRWRIMCRNLWLYIGQSSSPKANERPPKKCPKIQ